LCCGFGWQRVLTSGWCGDVCTRGLACGRQIVFTTEQDDPHLHIISRDPDFTGNMLLIDAERGESDSFNMIQTLANGNVLFTVNGKGEVRRHLAVLSLEVAMGTHGLYVWHRLPAVARILRKRLRLELWKSCKG